MSRARIDLTQHSITVELEVGFRREGREVVAYCPALELSSYGKSERAAERAFLEALGIFLAETVRKGTLERELLALGWSLRKKPEPRYDPPRLSEDALAILAGSERRLEHVSIPV